MASQSTSGVRNGLWMLLVVAAVAMSIASLAWISVVKDRPVPAPTIVNNTFLPKWARFECSGATCGVIAPHRLVGFDVVVLNDLPITYNAVTGVITLTAGHRYLIELQLYPQADPRTAYLTDGPNVKSFLECRLTATETCSMRSYFDFAANATVAVDLGSPMVVYGNQGTDGSPCQLRIRVADNE